jgi:hypothetical protein
MSWEALLSIISILIAALSIISWLLIEQWKERRRLKEKHFTEIKDGCLKPLLEELKRLKNYFNLGEGGPEWDQYNISEELGQEIRWWKLFSFKNGFNVDQFLYEDLKNHYPNLYRDLENVETWIKTKYAEYLQAILNLLNSIEDDMEFKKLEQELEPKGPVIDLPFLESLRDIRRAIFS